MIETLEAGRDAIARHAWTEAVEALTEGDRATGLAPADLESLAAASWWATRQGRNYAGQGVHIAARIGAAAAREEILVSSATLSAAGPVRFSLSEPRSLDLKGVRDPVAAQTVVWRQMG